MAIALPAWATWKLFWKVAPFVGGLLLILGGLWYVDHRGYKRAEDEAILREAERARQLAEFELLIAEQARNIETIVQNAITESDGRVVAELRSLDTVNQTVIQPTLTKEIQREVRFTDPAAGITDIMRQEINRARGFSEQRPCPTGSNAVTCFALPDPEPVGGQ